MKTKILLFILFLISTTNTLAENSPYDWVYYAEMMQNNESYFLFYSSNSVKANQDGNLKVWTKAVATKDIQKSFTVNKTHITSDSKKTITLLPNHTEIYKLDNLNDTSMSLMFSEYVVNNFDVNQQTLLLNELDCKNEKLRVPAIRIYEGKNEPIVDDNQNSKWRYITPRTFDSLLMSLICKA